MKTLKRLTAIGTLLLVCTIVFPQLKVSSSGDVGIGMTTTPAEQLHINGSIRGDQTGGALKIQTDYGYTSIAPYNGTFAHFYTDRNQFYFGKTIMVNGGFAAYNGQNLYLRTYYTTRMTILTSNGYVGIGDTSPSFKLDVDGTIGAYETLLHSDERLKKDIAEIDKQQVRNLYNLKAKTFTWDKSILETGKGLESSNDTVLIAKETNTNELDTTPKIGFIAQELIEYFPNLVKQDDEGFYNINYVSLIPVLVEAVKDHQERIIYLEEELEKLKSDYSSLKSESINLISSEPSIDNTEKRPYLSQNTPNPYSQDTKIDFYIPSEYTFATLNIYDMQGTQMKSYELKERGNSSLTVHGSEFNPGMYLYTLIVDGYEVDTKRMILTD
ncbi:tail fiber domain-containing protein [Bacteroidota bacterium]